MYAFKITAFELTIHTDWGYTRDIIKTNIRYSTEK